MGEVHSYGRQLAQNWIAAIGRAFQKLRPEPKRLIRWMTHAEHPLVALHGPHAAADLISQGLEGQTVVGRGQGRSDAVGWTLRLEFSEKAIDGLFEATVEQVFKPGKGDQASVSRGSQFGREVEPMERRQEEQRPNPLVQILGIAAELVEGGARFKQLGQTCRPGPGLQRAVPHGRLWRRDEVDERVGGHDGQTIPEGLPVRQRLEPFAAHPKTAATVGILETTQRSASQLRRPRPPR